MWKTKGKKQRTNSFKIDTLLGKNTSVQGDLEFHGGLQLDGLVRGNVTAEGANSVLIVAENGRVEGEIHVENVIIRGQVIGPVYAAKTLELASSANVMGDVFYTQIEVHMGAKLSGKTVCVMEKPLQGELIHEKSTQPHELKSEPKSIHILTEEA